MGKKGGMKIFSEISTKGLTRSKMLDIIGEEKRGLGNFLVLMRFGIIDGANGMLDGINLKIWDKDWEL